VVVIRERSRTSFWPDCEKIDKLVKTRLIITKQGTGCRKSAQKARKGKEQKEKLNLHIFDFKCFLSPIHSSFASFYFANVVNSLAFGTRVYYGLRERVTNGRDYTYIPSQIIILRDEMRDIFIYCFPTQLAFLLLPFDLTPAVLYCIIALDYKTSCVISLIRVEEERMEQRQAFFVTTWAKTKRLFFILKSAMYRHFVPCSFLLSSCKSQLCK